jgi:hypothetical protein
MARPQRNNIDYFPFMCDEGQKMFYLEQTYGNDGFAVFVKLLRELAKKDYHYLNLSDKSAKMFLAAKCHVSIELLTAIIDDLANLGKFDKELWSENSIVWCQDFIDSIQDAYLKLNNKCITYEGLLTLLQGLGYRKLGKSTLTGTVKPQSKVEYSIVDKSKEELGDKSPPTKTILEREIVFRNSLIPFVEKYSKESVRAFFDYWSEKNPQGKKMKFEMQKTFETEKRLQNWKRKEEEFNSKNKNGTGFQSTNTKGAAELKSPTTGRSFFGTPKTDSGGSI